jgi:hypothetical protein
VYLIVWWVLYQYNANHVAHKVWNSSNKNSRWSFDPRNGLTLKNPTVFDSAFYYVFGHLPFVNGKPVNITLNRRDEQITKKVIRRIFPVDRIDAIDGIKFTFVVPGNQNKKFVTSFSYRI